MYIWDFDFLSNYSPCLWTFIFIGQDLGQIYILAGWFPQSIWLKKKGKNGGQASRVYSLNLSPSALMNGKLVCNILQSFKIDHKQVLWVYN